MNEQRRKVLFDAMKTEEDNLSLSNKEIQIIFEKEATEMFQETARDLKGFLHDIIVKSLEGTNLKEFVKENEDDS